MWGRARRARRYEVIALLEAEIDRLTEEGKAKDEAIASLQKGLAYATDPFNMQQAQAVVDTAVRETLNPDAAVVQAPDGEYIAPAAFNWEKLAHDIYEAEQGGASGEW